MGSDIRASSFVHHHSQSPYRDQKLAAASAAITSIAARLGLSPTRVEEGLCMANSAIGGNLASPGTLVRLYRDNGMWKKATELITEMLELGVELDVKIYNGLIDTLGKYGQLPDAHKVFDKMCAEGVKPDIATWNTLI